MTGFDMTETIAPRSDQQNFDDYIAGPRTVTISEVKAGSAEQPVELHLVEYPGRPFKPSKSMRRVLVAAWGADGSVYAGRRMTLVGDPTVRFGGAVVGGVRISHLSHIDKPLNLSLTVTKGKRAPFTVQPLPDLPDYVSEAKAAQTIDAWRQVWGRAKGAGHLTDALKAQLVPLGEALKPVARILPVDPPELPTDEPPLDEGKWPTLPTQGGDQ